MKWNELIIKKVRILPCAFLILLTAVGISMSASLDRIRTESRKTTSFIADFVQEKHLRILDRPFISTGRFYFQAPDSIRWEYMSPVHSILLVDHGITKHYVKTEKGFEEDKSAMFQPIMQFVFQEIGLWIRGRFSDDPVFRIDKGAKNRISLIPKDKGMSMMIKRIELDFSSKPGIINSIMIIEGDGSYTIMKFIRVSRNVRIDKKLFSEI
jgi:outer membrane lipoprotein-sorting protein